VSSGIFKSRALDRAAGQQNRNAKQGYGEQACDKEEAERFSHRVSTK